MDIVNRIKRNYKEERNCYSCNALAEGFSMLFNKLIWGIDDVCSVTTYKKGTIYNLVSSGSIPYKKRRGKLFFIPSEILSWVQNV